MSKLNQRSSNARIVSIIVVFGLIPAWFFYIGVKYQETMDVLENNQDSLQAQLSK